MTVSERLAALTMACFRQDPDPSVYKAAKAHFIDTLACIFLGANSQSARIASSYVQQYGGEPCAIFPNSYNLRTDAASCAMLYAIAAHSNDFDDMSESLNGHPSTILVPVALAMGQKGKKNGQDVLRAYIAGVEVDAMVGRLFKDKLKKGWNPTTFLGVFGATATAGCLLDLNEKQLVDAFGIATGEAGGQKQNYGYLAKDLTAGRTAEKGVLSAEMAKLGVRANNDAFEGAFGLFASLTDGVSEKEFEQAFQNTESEFVFPGLTMKPYPSCRGNHCGIDCITKIKGGHPFESDEVEQIQCKVSQAAWDTDRYVYPENPEQAKFSLAYCIARVISGGSVLVEDFLGETITDQRALQLISKVQVKLAPEEFPTGSFGTEVILILKDGTVYREKACLAKGDPTIPMTDEEITMKLRTCLRLAPVDPKHLDKILTRLLHFDEADSLEKLLTFV